MLLSWVEASAEPLSLQRLTEEGLDVAVFDKRDVCAGSTSASTALLQYEIDTSLIDLSKRIGRSDAEQAYRLCHDSITAIERLVIDLKVECVFQRRKSAYLASRPSDAASLREECAARRAAGIDVEYWDEARVGARFSFSRPAALVSSSGGRTRLSSTCSCPACACGPRGCAYLRQNSSGEVRSRR